MPLANYAESKVLNHLLRGRASVAPSAVYLALYTVAPTDAGGGTEVTGGAYARAPATFADAAGTGLTTNEAIIQFPTATGGWGTVPAVGVHDAATAGNLLWYGPLTTAKQVVSGNTPTFEIGFFTITLE